ncbi:MAG: thioredoxin [Coriobacteriales bacterium]|nr:thioredoxin [Coriobacteriales bacterium]
MPEPIVLDALNFDSTVLESEIPFLVDFWAPWCGPCRSIAPIVSQIADERSGSLAVGKLDIVDYPEIADRYNIEGIPALILFRDGAPAAISIGAVPKDTILKNLSLT